KPAGERKDEQSEREDGDQKAAVHVYETDARCRIFLNRVAVPALAVRPMGSRLGASLRAGLQLPERPDQAEPGEDRLVLVAAAWPPVRVQPCIPPGVCQVAQGLRRDRRARRPGAEPTRDVLLRPEEVHRASREDDVVPPVRRGDDAVEEQVWTTCRPIADFDHIRLAAVGAGGLDSPVCAERAEN